MTIEDVCAFLGQMAPEDTAEAWDNPDVYKRQTVGSNSLRGTARAAFFIK